MTINFRRNKYVLESLSCPICGQPPYEGQWGAWSGWGTCVYAYGTYSETRMRYCSSSECPGGDGSESRACNPIPSIPPQCDTCGCSMCQNTPPPCISCGRKKRLAMQAKLLDIKKEYLGRQNKG
ncbi:hypothetical protein L596_009306 [Steinernema carpocapsae]|uniref:Uncharacterized protein n=1 Tax=Steinernema carpocapsae TaxID=34508 RepID=A0A4U5PFR6_STECR|nr:hypothetical protein L596_009306 [Steinernema carpocapsae]